MASPMFSSAHSTRSSCSVPCPTGRQNRLSPYAKNPYFTGS
jgi:hypothetical protein